VSTWAPIRLAKPEVVPMYEQTPVTPALSIEGLTVRYGPITAVHEVTVTISPGECVALVGPNGAGKSSLIAACMGVIPIAGGTILMNGSPIHRSASHSRVRSGLAVVPEGRQVIGTLTVKENLEMGGYWQSRNERQKRLSEMFENFPRLEERREQTSSTMSGGEQQMLAIARALMSNPKVMLMDEPTMGLAPVIVEDVLRVIRSITEEQNTAILLVEQNARAALRVARRGYIMSHGRIVDEGTVEYISDSDRLATAYLG